MKPRKPLHDYIIYWFLLFLNLSRKEWKILIGWRVCDRKWRCRYVGFAHRAMVQWGWGDMEHFHAPQHAHYTWFKMTPSISVVGFCNIRRCTRSSQKAWFFWEKILIGCIQVCFLYIMFFFFLRSVIHVPNIRHYLQAHKKREFLGENFIWVHGSYSGCFYASWCYM